jgi:hypothetical protein
MTIATARCFLIMKLLSQVASFIQTDRPNDEFCKQSEQTLPVSKRHALTHGPDPPYCSQMLDNYKRSIACSGLHKLNGSPSRFIVTKPYKLFARLVRSRDRGCVVNRIYRTLAEHKYNLTELHAPDITVTAAHIKSSQSSLAVAW